MYRFFVFVIILQFLSLHLSAQAPKREFRGAWIATVSNIDWPSKPGLPALEQQREFIYRLDQLQALGCNAVIVQVRPASDALYQSDIEPWSRFLTGKVGLAPFPFYDPLTFMIKEAHERNMELHAWFNPFRGLTQSDKNPNPAHHITKQHPEWLINYGGKGYLNPGEPQVSEYVLRVIMDVVKRYDIDGVHIDDYFYPYRISGVEFGDQASYNKYKGEFTNKDDWRRNNVTTFIKNLYAQIKAQKRYVKFGISPFGVWRNQSKDPLGSATRGGQTCYDDLYSDVRLWQEKGWVDYMLPQLYWEHGHRAAAFETLLPWWEANQFNRHMYYGLGVYRMLPPVKAPWTGTGEIHAQIEDIRRQAKNSGFVFYSASNFDKINPLLKKELTQQHQRYPAFPPTMPWLDNIAPAAPAITRVIGSNRDGNLIQWTMENPAKEMIRFAVYRFAKNQKVDINQNANLIALFTSNKNEYLDKAGMNYPECTYVVTALDRLWNESKPSNVKSVLP